MPLPIGHSLAGYALFETQRLRFFEKKWKEILFFAALAVSPDFDYLPGFLLGNPNLYHHSYAHSLGAAIVVGLGGAVLFGKKNGRFLACFAIIGGVYYSHLILDFFNTDTRAPYGVMLFWPFSSDYFMSPWPVFLSVAKTSDSSTFFRVFLSAHNLQVALRELLVMGPVVLGVVGVKRLLRRRKNVILQSAAKGETAAVLLNED